MKMPKMKIRPTSQQSCASFGGVLHSPTAPVGTWYDCRNLSSDYSPTVTPVKPRAKISAVDGNEIRRKIIAVCGGERMVLLDEWGFLWCGGNNVRVSAVIGQRYYWEINHEYKRVPQDPPYYVQVQYEMGNDQGNNWDTDGKTFKGGLQSRSHTNHRFVLRNFTEDSPEAAWWEETHATEGSSASTSVRSRTQFIPAGSGDYPDHHTWVFHDYGFKVWVLAELGFDFPSSYTVTISTHAGHYDGGGGGNDVTLIRMGANVLVIPRSAERDGASAMWVNVVKLSGLAAGEEMQFGEDYGWLDYKSYKASDVDNMTTLELCDVDGNVYDTATVSSTEPVDNTQPWLDTSTNPPSLRQYAAYTSTWVVIPRTFIKISPVRLTDFNGSKLKAGDTVHIKASYFPDFTQPMVQSILEDGYHYIEAIVEADNAIVIPGLMNNVRETTTAAYTIERDFPQLDFFVECGNRIWGCRYDEEKTINEIYASRLGDASNWDSFQGLSTDSWRASRGGAAKYTGAAVLGDHPLFFREDSLEKVFPSAVGAHQVQRVDLEGVEEGAADSLCVIHGRLYYKSRGGVMVYDGALPRLISDNFGDMVFSGGSGAMHQRKYCLSTRLYNPNLEDGTGASLPNPWEPVVLVYDTERGVWHMETETWTGVAVTWQDNLYYVADGQLLSMSGDLDDFTEWYAETAPQAIRYNDGSARSITEHKWISYFRIRYRAFGEVITRAVSTQDPTSPAGNAPYIRLYISYNDGPWELKKDIEVSPSKGLRTIEVNFLPRRRDNFRIRLEGYGPVQIFDMAWRVERSEAGH